MFAYTDTRQTPWFVVDTDSKKNARLNLISHLLEQIPYRKVEQEKVKLPPPVEFALRRGAWSPRAGATYHGCTTSTIASCTPSMIHYVKYYG